MEVDVASLAVRMDSRDIKKGKTELAGLTKEAGKTEKAVGKTEKATQKMNKSFSAMSLAAAVAGSAMAYQLGRVGAAAIKAASDLEEADSKFQTVFRGQVTAAQKMADQLNESYGQSRREAREYLAAMQDLLVPMGMGRIAAGKLSNEIVKLGTDLGSFNNRKTADVMRDIQGALVGEFEAMKKYGSILNATLIQEKAFAMGLAETKNQLTAADKAQAAYQLIVESSTDAMGDFNRTSAGYANTTKTLDAAWEDFAATLGTKFLPAASATKKFMASILSEATKVITATETLERLRFESEKNQISRELRLAKRGGNEALIEMLMDQMDALNEVQFKKIAERHAREKKERDAFLALQIEDEEKAADQLIEIKQKGQAALDKINAKAEADRISLNQARFRSILSFAREEEMVEQERIDSNSRMFAQIVSQSEDAMEDISDVSRNMNAAIQSGMADVFGDALRGDLDSFEDYFGAFTNSLTNMWAQMAAQMVMDKAKMEGTSGTGSSGTSGSGATTSSMKSNIILSFAVVAANLIKSNMDKMNKEDAARMEKLTAEYVQGNQLTGSILGNIHVQSESTTNALDDILTTDIAGLEISKGMLAALNSVASNNERLAAGIGRGATGMTSPYYKSTTEVPFSQQDKDFFDRAVTFGLEKYTGATTTTELFARAFGSKKKSLIDSGLQVYSQTLADIMGETFTGAGYATIQTTTRKFFKKKSRTSDQLSGLSADVSGALGDMFDGVADALSYGADTFGIAMDGMYSRLTISEQKISLKGKTAEEAAEIIGNFVSMTADSWAETMLTGTGLLESYQQAGEGAFETYSRLVNQTDFFSSSLESLGLSLGAIGIELVNIGQDTIAAAGGIDALSSSMSGFYNAFYSDAEKQVLVAKQMSAAFSDMNMILPATREGYKNIVTALDLTNAADQERFTNLTAMYAVSDKYYSSLEKVAEATAKAEEEAAKLAATTMANLVQSVADLAEEAEKLTKEAKEAADTVISLTLAVASADVAAAFDTQAAAINAAYDSVIGSLNDSLSNASESARDMERAFSALGDAKTAIIGTISGDQNYKAVQAEMVGALSAARAGDLSAALAVSGKLGAITGGPSGAASEIEFRRENLRNLAAITELESLTGAQLTVDEMIVAALESQIAVMEDSKEITIQQNNDLLNAINNMDASILALPSTMNAISGAQQSLLTDMTLRQLGALGNVSNQISSQGYYGRSQAASLSSNQINSLLTIDGSISQLPQPLQDQITAITGMDGSVLTIPTAIEELERLQKETENKNTDLQLASLFTLDETMLGVTESVRVLSALMTSEAALKVAEEERLAANALATAQQEAEDMAILAAEAQAAASAEALRLEEARQAAIVEAARVEAARVAAAQAAEAEAARIESERVAAAAAAAWASAWDNMFDVGNISFDYDFNFGPDLSNLDIPGFATGGTHSGGLRMVGENGPELEYTGPSKIINNSDTNKMFDNSDLIQEIRDLRADLKRDNYQSVKTEKRTLDILDKWDVLGLPETQEVA